PPKPLLDQGLEAGFDKMVEVLVQGHQLDRPATVCQSSSRRTPSNTIRPSPRSDGSQDSPWRFRLTVSGNEDRVQSVVSAPDSPQSDSAIAVATAPVPHARVSASTPLS